jgi:hypothetical protein
MENNQPRTNAPYEYKILYAVRQVPAAHGRFEEKWVRIGVMFPTRGGGDKVVLEALPLTWDGVTLLTRMPKARDQGAAQPETGDDDIPF